MKKAVLNGVRNGDITVVAINVLPCGSLSISGFAT
jgi:hypothetical protein